LCRPCASLRFSKPNVRREPGNHGMSPEGAMAKAKKAKSFDDEKQTFQIEEIQTGPHGRGNDQAAEAETHHQPSSRRRF
jgi:hypothetical protein